MATEAPTASAPAMRARMVYPPGRILPPPPLGWRSNCCQRGFRDNCSRQDTGEDGPAATMGYGPVFAAAAHQRTCPYVVSLLQIGSDCDDQQVHRSGRLLEVRGMRADLESVEAGAAGAAQLGSLTDCGVSWSLMKARPQRYRYH